MWTRGVVAVILLAGVVSSYPQFRVVNGSDSDIERYPFMVSLRGSEGIHFCGGTILNSHWVLTAAHCVDGRMVDQINIQFGVTKVNPTGPNIMGAKTIIVHEDYNSTSVVNDIALLELKDELVFDSKTVAPVILPAPFFETPQVYGGSAAVLIGWGLNATGGMRQQHLQEVDQKIFAYEECNRHYGLKFTSDQICAGIDEGGKGSCKTDSGGPLLYKGNIQVGIVSYGNVKVCAATPSVYTKVSHYIQWIVQYVQPTSEPPVLL